MIGLLLRPGGEPAVVEAVDWTRAIIRHRLGDPTRLAASSFDAPGEQGGRMIAVYAADGAGPINRYATALAAAPIRGAALILRARVTGDCSLSEQDCLALATQLVVSEYRVPGRGRRAPRRGHHPNRAG